MLTERAVYGELAALEFIIAFRGGKYEVARHDLAAARASFARAAEVNMRSGRRALTPALLASAMLAAEVPRHPRRDRSNYERFWVLHGRGDH